MECAWFNRTTKSSCLTTQTRHQTQLSLHEKKQYRIGKRTLLDLLNTENELFEARKGYLDAKYDEQYANIVMNATGNLLIGLRVEIPEEWNGKGGILMKLINTVLSPFHGCICYNALAENNEDEFEYRALPPITQIYDLQMMTMTV